MSERVTVPQGVPLYFSPLGLYPFQEEGIAQAYLMESALMVWDTGTGKSHAAMCLSAMLFEDNLIDVVLLIVEKNKISEWKEDFDKFTQLVSMIHHGSGRQKRLEKVGLPQVLITTYETAKADLVDFYKAPGKRGTSVQNKALLDQLLTKNVFVVYDEVAKLRKRTAATYKAHYHIVKMLRKKNPNQRVLGLTATPLERDYEDAFNQMRIVRPDLVPNVGDFEKTYVLNRDQFGRPTYYPIQIQNFVNQVQLGLIRKRKTDPDIIEQFPKRIEEAQHVQMKDDQQKLYQMVESLGYGSEEPVQGLWTVLRQIAGHPASVLHGSENPEGSMIAKKLVQELGKDVFRNTSSAKMEALLDYLKIVVKGQGAKAVVFTFFGQSILRDIREELIEAGYKVYVNHGEMSIKQQQESRQSFKSDPKPAIFLTSDAGSRGINLPEATYVIEYESALTFANRTQRLDRIHRIDSNAPSVTCLTLFLDDTIEDAIAENMIKRNDQTDILLGDTDAGRNHVLASERKKVLQINQEKSRRP